MNMAELGPGYVRVLVETPKHRALIEAAKALAVGKSPADEMKVYVREAREKTPPEFSVDLDFGAIPIGRGQPLDAELSSEMLDPERSEKFLVRGFVRANSLRDVPHDVGGQPVYSDPMIGGHLTCGSSRFLGETSDVKLRLDTATLAENGLDGSGVAIAIMDSGIFLPHLTEHLGSPPAFDAANSWPPNTVVTQPGIHRLGHGTMCAYDALIAAPKATLLDFAMLIGRAPGDHTAQGSISVAIEAYWLLVYRWLVAPGGVKPNYRTVVVSNSWGIFHPSLDLPNTHPGRYIDNPAHPFRVFTMVLAAKGMDVVFAASNCGTECPSAVCIGETKGMIMGANAYDEVLTLAGCDIYDVRVGYSSQGPSIGNMPHSKPDLTAYTHFLGSRNRRAFLPDSGTSAACAVAAGCIAALRTKLPPSTPSATLFQALKSTAHQVGGLGWNPDYGHGIIRPLDAARSLGLVP
jgi:subtilisin family serine protease